MEERDIARRVAARACYAFKDASKVNLCVELLTKILVHGEQVKDDVTSEFRKHFIEEERRLVGNELERVIKSWKWRLF